MSGFRTSSNQCVRFSSLTETGYCDILDNLRCVAIVDTLVYLGGTNSFWAVNVRNPEIPQLIGQCDSPWAEIYDVEVSGSYAYVACRGFYAIEVSDPTSPHNTGGFQLPGSMGRGIVISGSYAYIANEYNGFFDRGGLVVANLSNPASPSLVTTMTPFRDGRGLAIGGKYVYLSHTYLEGSLGPGALIIADISTPTSPSEISAYEDLPIETVLLGISPNYVYVAERYLRLIDVSLPVMPEEATYYPAVQYIVVRDSLALCIDSKFRILDISDPLNPVEIGSADTSWSSIWHMTCTDSYAYVGDGGKKVWIVDIKDLYAPRILSSCSITDFPFHVVAKDTCVFVAENGRIEVLTFGDPSNPYKIGEFTSVTYPRGLGIYDNYLFVADCANGKGLIVLDISDPSNPQLVASSITSNSFCVRVDYPWCFVDEWDGGSGVYIRAFDILNPEFPEEVGYYYSTPCQCVWDLKSDNSYIYIANDFAGVQIYKHFLFIDMGVDNIVTPSSSDSFPKDTVVTPQVSFTNYGNTRCCPEISLAIGGFYSATSEIDTFGTGESKTVTFPTCTLSTPGWQTVHCSSYCVYDTIALNNTLLDSIYVMTVGTQEVSQLPQTFSISQNYPNPFVTNTAIRYAIPKYSHTTLKIYDIAGKLVRTLVDKPKKPAYYSVSWNGRDDKGKKLTSGIYFIKFEAGNFIATRKLTILR